MNAAAVEKQVDYVAIKEKQQSAWAAGDYSAVGVTLQWVGEQLCETARCSSR